MVALLDAAERLLSEAGPEAVSVADVCALAGVTTGAFYARFRDKEALFRALEELVYDSFAEARGRFLAASADHGLRDLLKALIASTVGLYRRHRGAIRAIRMLALSDPERAARVAAHNRALLDAVVDLLLERRTEIERPDAREAVTEVVIWIVAILRQQLLFDELSLASAPVRQTRLADLGISYLRGGGG